MAGDFASGGVELRNDWNSWFGRDSVAFWGSDDRVGDNVWTESDDGMFWRCDDKPETVRWNAVGRYVDNFSNCDSLFGGGEACEAVDKDSTAMFIERKKN